MNKKYYTDVNNLQSRDEDGLALRDSEDKLVYAIKTEKETRENTYEIRLDAHGGLYNPYNPSGLANRPTQKQSLIKGSVDYAVVSKEVFDLYLKFLNSYRVIYLKQAEGLKS